MDKKLVGRFGEQAAAEYLKKKRYKIVGMNYSCRFGEIDLIAENRKYVVFVEVKLRKSDKFAEAKEFVTQSKQEKIIKTASLWLSQNETELQPRFDVIEIYAPEGIESKSIKINHIENAFQ
ncbi:MAG: YraN family protein [Clostridiales bacterium]|jgi:putative endonuclease|nr:YraN family protein [Clostridiales bacterium]